MWIGNILFGNWNRKLEIIKENILKESFLLMRLYDWAMVIISYFLSFSYNRTMKIWKQKKKERMSLGLDLWWPNWLRRSLIIKRKGGACEEEAGYNSSDFLKPTHIHEKKEFWANWTTWRARRKHKSIFEDT